MRFLNEIRRLLDQLEAGQLDAIDRAAAALAAAIRGTGSIFAFGSSHANLIAQEMIYRTGALAVVNPIPAPGLQLDIQPLTLGSQMERYPRYGADLVRFRGITAGDVVILHSVSGRNTVIIDAAITARELGATVIAITNLAYSRASESRHPSGQLLYQCADIVIDNCGAIGDAALDFDSLPTRAVPTSTVMGAVIVNLILERTIERLEAEGVEAPVLQSANLPGGDAYNERIFAKFGARIHYM
ncbi:MAG: sugar isomerase domain-containing protein [Bacillota bacterium]|nr:sugar isomerase domain-containing protein [Bacillota bacterium]